MATNILAKLTVMDYDNFSNFAESHSAMKIEFEW